MAKGEVEMTKREKIYMGIAILAMFTIIAGVITYFIVFGKEDNSEQPMRIAEEKIVDDCVLERRELGGDRRGK